MLSHYNNPTVVVIVVAAAGPGLIVAYNNKLRNLFVISATNLCQFGEVQRKLCGYFKTFKHTFSNRYNINNKKCVRPVKNRSMFHII